MIELLFDYDSDSPQLIVRFKDMDDLVAFLVGFFEQIDA